MRFTACVERRSEPSGRGRTARRFEVLAARPAWQGQVARIAQSGSGEQRLLAALLVDAMAALRGKHPEALVDARGRQHGTASPAAVWCEAVQWVCSRDAKALTAFESVCAVLELPTAGVRRDLLALAAQHARSVGVASVVQLAILPLAAMEAVA